MLGIIVDVCVKEIYDYVQASSCADLSLLTDNIIGHTVKELSCVGVERCAVLSRFCNKSIIDCECISFFDNSKSVINFLENTSETHCLVSFTDIFFEVSNGDFSEKLCFTYNCCLCDSEGEIGCFVIDKKSLIFLLYNYENLNADIILNSITLPQLKCLDCCNKITSVFSYKKILKNIISQKTSVSLPTVAEGVYAIKEIPKGDFVIVPPVFFGSDVQIESGCVIGPCTVISDNGVISKNSCIKNTVLQKDCYVSNGCYCDNMFCCENVSIRRNTAIFSGSVIGKNSSIGEGSCIENNSLIRPYSKYNNHKKTDVNYVNNSAYSSAGFCGYTPEKAALLGACLGVAFKNKKVGLLSNGEINSSILKMALLSGLMSVGSVCFDFGFSYQSSIVYYVNYCDLDYGLFIDGTDDGTIIFFVDKNGETLSDNDLNYIKDLLSDGKISRCSKKDCKSVTNIHGIKRIYESALTRFIKKEIPFYPVFNCSNLSLKNTIESALSKIKCKIDAKRVYFNINRTGTWCEAVLNNKNINQNKLKEFVSFYSENLISDNSKIRQYDAVFLCFCILEIVSKTQMDFETEVNNVPSFYIAEKIIETDRQIPFIASKLSDSSELYYNNNELLLDKGDLKIKVFNNGKGNMLKILARSVSAETAEEEVGKLAEIIEEYIKKS